MNWVESALQALGVTGRNVFRARTTTELPWRGHRDLPERYRTSFALVHDEHGDEACIGCKMCERICPSDVITVKTGTRRPSEKTAKQRGWIDDFTLDLNACIHCELCVQVCPTDAIVMLRVQDKPGYSREELFLTRERLYANEGESRSWGNGTRLVEMQEPTRGVPRPEEEGAAPEAPKEEPRAERRARRTRSREGTPEEGGTATPAAAPSGGGGTPPVEGEP